MAQSGRFSLAVRILTVLASEPERRHTSAEIAEALSTSPVMVRRLFGALHRGGFIVQRKGPSGGAKLKQPAKSIGLGDVFLATEPNWLTTGDPTLAAAVERARKDAVAAMNETSLAGLVKRLKKAESADPQSDGAV